MLYCIAGKNPVLQENVPPINTSSEKRLTKVEQARREALSAFGNCPFNSLVVKRDCFKSKLKVTAAKSASSRKESIRRPTRMEKARQEANEAFKNISLGQKRKASVIEKKSETQPETQNAKKRLTRLERCKLEAQQAFGNAPLSTLIEGRVQEQQQNGKRRGRLGVEVNLSGIKNVETIKKDTKKSFGRRSIEKSVKEKRKSTSKGKQNRRSASRRRSSAIMRRKSSTKGSRLTKVQASQLEALKSFGGQSLENVWKSKDSPPASEGVAVTVDDTCQSVEKPEILDDSLKPVGMVTCDRHSTCQQESGIDVEITLNEHTAESSSQTGLQVVDESTQISGSRDSEMQTEACDSNEVNEIADASMQNAANETPPFETCEDHVYAREKHVRSLSGMAPIPEQSPPEASARSSITPVDSKPLTRLQKARLEAFQSFNGQAFEHVIKTSTRKMARYLTPVKHQGTNTEVNMTRNTPSQTDDSYYKGHPRPKKSVYSNLRENSFCDRGALLESSKIVVFTARSLDTPSPGCSPANT